MRTIARQIFPRLKPSPFAPASLENPLFEFTFYSGGRPYNITQDGRNQDAAQAEALIELAHQCPDIDARDIRLVSCIQRR